MRLAIGLGPEDWRAAQRTLGGCLFEQKWLDLTCGELCDQVSWSRSRVTTRGIGLGIPQGNLKPGKHVERRGKLSRGSHESGRCHARIHRLLTLSCAWFAVPPGFGAVPSSWAAAARDAPTKRLGLQPYARVVQVGDTDVRRSIAKHVQEYLAAVSYSLAFMTFQRRNVFLRHRGRRDLCVLRAWEARNVRSGVCVLDTMFAS